MKKKALFISLGASLVLASGGGGGVYWWYMNRPEQLMARAQELLTANDTAAATTILTDLAAQGYPEADQQLAQLLAEGKISAPDDTTAARWWQLLAEQGHVPAMREMAARYEQGRGVEQDWSKAAHWLKPFAAKGEEDALRKLCGLYMSGSLPINDEAIHWYRAAGDKGQNEATRALADCYAQGKGVEKNPVEAAKLYAQVITPDDAEGHFFMATCLAEAGKMDEAHQHEQKAADLGHAVAQSNVGCKYFDERQYTQATPLLQAAAKAGNAPAAARLALCFEHGLGVPQDKEEARQWQAIAQQGGIDTATLPCPTPTVSQGTLCLSSPFATMADTKDLLSYQEAVVKKAGQEKAEEGSKFKETIGICDANKTISPVFYERSIDTFKGKCLIVNDDFIATIKNDVTIDFWDSRSLRYHFSIVGMRERQSDEFYQYDAEHGHLGYRVLPIDNAAYYGGWMGCTAINFNNLQTEFNAQDTFELYGTALIDNIPKQSGEVFKQPVFRPLNKLSQRVLVDDNWVYFEPANQPERIKNFPALRDIEAEFRSVLEPLDVSDIDPATLTIHRQEAPKQKPEKSEASAPELTARDIPQLDSKKEWKVDTIEGDLYFITSLYDDYDSDALYTYVYNNSTKTLYPVLPESGFDGSPEAFATAATIGESDIAWHTVTRYSWAVKLHSEWMGDCVWDKTNNRLYGIQYLSEHDTWRGWNPEDGTTHPLAGIIKLKHYGGCNLLSVWNRIPGTTDKAYWIAAGERGWSLCSVSADAKDVQEIAHGAATWQKGQVPQWMPERQWFCVPLNENVWQIFHFDSQALRMQELCYIYLHHGDEFAVVLPDGRYAGSPGCETFLYMLKEGRRLGMAALAPWRNRPAEVLEALGGNADDIAVLRHTTERWLRRQGYSAKTMPAEPAASDFPGIVVARPSLRTNAASATITMQVQAAAGKAVTRVEIRADGSLIPQDWSKDLYIAPGTTTTLQADIPLIPGQNWIEATAIDSTGLRSNTERFRILSEKSAQAPRLYLISLGVSQYKDSSMNLQYAAKDASDIADAFKKHYQGEVQLLLLRDAEVKDASVLQQVRHFIQQAAPQDQVIMYCAGHGMLDDETEYHYAPHEFDSEHIASSGISMEALLNTIEQSPARTRLMLLDTCHSGSLGEEGEEKMALAMGNLPSGVRAIQHRGMKVKKVESTLNTAQKKRYIEELFASGSTHRGINVLAGAAGAEFALESGEWKNGVFTASLIESISNPSRTDTNKDGAISVAELCSAVTAAVSHRTAGLQHPTTSALENKGGQILLRSAAKAAAQIPAAPLAPAAANDTASIVRKRIRLSEPYEGTMAGSMLQQDIADCCAPHINILPKNIRMSRAELAKNLKAFGKSWPERSYQVLGVARNGNVIEVQVQYSCYKPGKSTSGYSLFTLIVNDSGLITSMGEKTAKSAPPAFSPGMQSVPYPY